MNDHKNIEELKKLAPKLAGIKKENPFETPKDYFDTLEDRILKKIPATTHNLTDQPAKKKAAVVVSFFKFVAKPQISIPAIAASLVLYFTFLFPTTDHTLNMEELASLLIEERIEIEDMLVYEAYLEDSFDDSESESGEEEIIDYLIDRNIDYSTIINEF